MEAFWKSNGPELIPPRILLLMTEYRNIANAHLSYHPNGQDTFVLSPLKDVNDMLIADKIQNRKDFELYHSQSHPRASKLQQYFIEWCCKLGTREYIMNPTTLHHFVIIFWKIDLVTFINLTEI